MLQLLSGTSRVVLHALFFALKSSYWTWASGATLHIYYSSWVWFRAVSCRCKCFPTSSGAFFKALSIYYCFCVNDFSNFFYFFLYCSYELHNFFVSGFLAFTLEPHSAVHFQFQPLLAEQKRERIVIISCAIIYLFFT